MLKEVFCYYMLQEMMSYFSEIVKFLKNTWNWVKSSLISSKNLISSKKIRHGVKVGPEPQESGLLDLGPPSKFKTEIRNPLKFKSGTPSPFFNELISFQNISSFFIIVSFLQNKYQLCVNTSQVHLKMGLGDRFYQEVVHIRSKLRF